MNPPKRTAEDVRALDDFLEMWSTYIPNFKISPEDMLKPRPMFVMEAVVQIFDALGLDADGVIQNTLDDPEDNENAETLNGLVPILSLTEAINTVLHSLSPDYPKITPFVLLTPTPSSTLSYLRFLLNYVVFVRGRQAEAQEMETQVEQEVQKLDRIHEEVDALRDQLNRCQAEGADRGMRIQQLEKKMEKLQIEPLELSEMIVEMEKELGLVQEESGQLCSLVEMQQAEQTELQHQHARIRLCVITPAEQSEVLKTKEIALQREQEATAAQQEANSCLWGREASIKMLHTNLGHIRELHVALDTNATLYQKINEVEKSNDPSMEGEVELENLRSSNYELLQRKEELRAADEAWKSDAHRAEAEAMKELDVALSDEKKSDVEYERCMAELAEYQRRVKEFKAATLNYNKEREQLITSYTEHIPGEYEKLIEFKIESIKNILNTLRKKITQK